MKIDLDNIDNDLLQELISHCEDNIASPYKEKASKKKMDLEALMSKEEPEEVIEEEDGLDMDEDTMRKLIEHYKSSK